MSNPKKNQILGTGKDLFFKHGFKRVTIEEICETAGVSKMTYYKHFANKMDLVKAIMEKILKESVAKYKNIMTSDIPFTEKIELQIQMKLEGTSEISNEFLDDLMVHGEPEMIEYMSEVTHSVMAMVYNDYLEAQKRGDIREDIKPEFIIYFLNKIYDMIKDENLVKMYEDPSQLAVELIKFFFYGISNKSANLQ